jgi:hypothetical protein
MRATGLNREPVTSNPQAYFPFLTFFPSSSRSCDGFRAGLRTEFLHAFLVYQVRSARPAHCNVLDVIVLTILEKVYTVFQAQTTLLLYFGYYHHQVGFEVLTAVSTKMAVFWVVAPCSLVEVEV